MNRIHNASNPNQGKFRRVLCVCSAGLLRSPTLAWVLSNDPYNCNTRAVGSRPEYALFPVDEVSLAWAPEIVFVNEANYDDVRRRFDLRTKAVYVLNVPDNFQYRDPELVKILHQELKNVGFLEGTP
jgi:predicted protein tyrosine phosphatase